MKRNLFGALAVFVSGCSALPDWSLFAPPASASQLSAPASIHFGWRMSGDREIAPLQVFDDGSAVWLQFGPAAHTPAIFARVDSGLVPLGYQRQGPYLIIDKLWPVLVLRGASLQTLVERISDAGHDINALQTSTDNAFHDDPDLAHEQVASVAHFAASPSEPTAISSTELDVPVDASVHGVTVPDATSEGMLEGQSSDTIIYPYSLSTLDHSTYRVSPQDQNMRLALSRWARAAGWTFEIEHWAVDVDIPIIGEASFEPPFENAVQQMLSSTEMADRPVQPCFYSNKVLRVVSYAHVCDRRSSPGST